MEIYISLAAMLVSLVSVLVSVAIYILGISRDKKQATLDAFNVLQEQVFDKINQYTYTEVRDISDGWKKVISDKRKPEQFTEDEKAYRDYIIQEYRNLSGLLARIEHFSLGVNTGIYNAKIAERAATIYFVSLYKKFAPLLQVKHSGPSDREFYAEFRKLVEKIQKIEKI